MQRRDIPGSNVCCWRCTGSESHCLCVSRVDLFLGCTLTPVGLDSIAFTLYLPSPSVFVVLCLYASFFLVVFGHTLRRSLNGCSSTRTSMNFPHGDGITRHCISSTVRSSFSSLPWSLVADCTKGHCPVLLYFDGTATFFLLSVCIFTVQSMRIEPRITSSLSTRNPSKHCAHIP